jgi:hypothetical protein
MSTSVLHGSLRRIGASAAVSAFKRIGASAALVALAAVPAAAQDPQTVEVTPYVAIGTSGASPVGVAITFPITSALGVETDVAYHRGEGDTHALSSNASLLWFLPRVGQSTPYLAAGVGLAQYGAPVLALNGPPIGTQPGLAITANAGGGLKVPVNSSLDLRTDARWLKSFGTHGSEQFRVAQGISFDVARR